MKLLSTIILFTVLLFSVHFSYSQPPAIQWQKTFGGTSYDQGTCTIQTTDGGFIATGTSTSLDGDVTGNHGFGDVWVVKMNSSGIVQWQKSYGGSNDDGAFAIIQTTDGGYAIAGSSTSANGDATLNHGSTDYWIIKTDASGNLQWQKSFGGSSDEIAYDIRQTSDLGFIIAGYTVSTDGNITANHGFEDYWIVKLNSTGTLEWQKTFGGSLDERAYSIQQTTDGGYVAGGYTRSNDGDVSGNHGDYDYWVIKLSNTGTLEWQKTLGGTLSDLNKTVQQTADGGYITAGWTASVDGDVTVNHGAEDLWLVKLDGSGVLQWQKSLGGTAVDQAFQVKQLANGDYVVAGSSFSIDGDVTGNHGGYDYWCARTDGSGNLLWEKSLGGSSVEESFSISLTTNNGYVLSGGSLSNDGDVTGNHGDFDYWIVSMVETATAAGYSFNSVAPAIISCGTQTSADISLTTTSVGGFVTAVNLTATGNPIGTTVGFSVNPVTPGNSAVVTLNSVNTLAPGTYDVTVTGIAGTVTQTAILTYIVQPGTAPIIATQPAAVEVCEGGNALFNVITPGPGISYQWQVSIAGGTFTDIPGGTLDSYTVTGVIGSQNNDQYQVILSTVCGTTTSVPALLTVNSATAITTQPLAAITLCEGTGNSFTVAASGSVLSYQWQVSTTGCAGSFTDITGANTTAYTLQGITAAQNGYAYRVIVTGGCAPTNIISSCGVLNVNPLPAVTAVADNQVVCSGDPAILTAQGAGAAGTYNWMPGNINGASFAVNPEVNPATPSLPNTITYAVTGTDGNGCTGTAIIAVTANPLPVVTLTTTPSTTALLPGQSVLMTATVTPAGAYTYTWVKDGVALSNTGNTLSVLSGETGAYSVTIDNGAGLCTAVSNLIKVTDSVLTTHYFYIYPNPNGGQFVIAYPGSGSVPLKRSVVVFDSKGARCYIREVTISRDIELISVDLRPAAAGTYIIAIYDENGNRMATEKVIVQL